MVRRLGWLLLLLGPGAMAADHVWIIGGGNDPDNSQAQIEFNVNWVMQVLRARPAPPTTHVYYTDGDAPGKDVKWLRPVAETGANLQPLARVFGAHEANREQYRNHDIRQVAGGTQADVLTERLAPELVALRPGDRALILYNGHGLRDARDAAGNTLRLWKDTRLSVREFAALLDRVDPQVPVRFIFTQCYSGGFARLIRPKAEDVTALAAGNRCGFFAESEDRQSEGCSASINIGDYRDYTTYFFAALHGRTRMGERIDDNADLDGDGVVTLHEAHLYVLKEARNADLPRATSEVYLERWQPWYLRWFDTGDEPDNVYGRLARELARDIGLPDSGKALAATLRQRRAEQEARLKAWRNEQDLLRPQSEALQKQLQQELARRWPEVRHPYTLNFKQFLARDLDAAQKFILAQPTYPELAAKQDRVTALDTEILHTDRTATQLDRVRRLRQLARLLDQFERHASAQERADYHRLSACEKLPL
jgi:hypothetical protein